MLGRTEMRVPLLIRGKLRGGQQKGVVEMLVRI